MLHGAVDEYLCLVQSLQWSAINKAVTATTFFEYSLGTYSLPSTVRTDKKGEIILIQEKIKFRGVRGSYILASSVPNQPSESFGQSLELCLQPVSLCFLSYGNRRSIELFQKCFKTVLDISYCWDYLVRLLLFLFILGLL